MALLGASPLLAQQAPSEGPPRLAPTIGPLPDALLAFRHPAPALTGFAPDDPRRAQAFIATLAHRYDQAHRVSATPAWRAIMGWGEPGETALSWSGAALDEAPGRYPSASGRSDARVDFVASVVMAWTEPGFSCHFPLRARVLARHGLTPTPLALDAGGCRDFEAWAALDTIEAVEVIYTTPSWSDPAATAGHLLLRLRPREDTSVVSRNAERVISYAVDMHDPQNHQWRTLKGLVGIHRGQLILNNNGEITHRYTVLESRDILVYTLRLDRDELRDLMALFWVQHAADSRVPYTFFSINCARMTYDALRTAIPELPRRPDWFSHPHEVISLLLAAGRLTPTGVHRSRRSVALDAERAQERLAPTLAPVPGFEALHAARWEDDDAREGALRRFARGFDPKALDPAQRAALTGYLDATIDIESHALDVRLGAFNDNALSPALEAALDLRAQLPIQTEARSADFPDAEILVSGSRRGTLRSGVDQRLAPAARLRLSVVDEQPGEPRASSLRRASRDEFLVSETVVHMEGQRAIVDEVRLTLLSTANYGSHVRTTEGWLSSRSGFSLDLGAQAFPSAGIPVGAWLRSGLSLTLAASDDDTALLAIGADVALGAWATDEGAAQAGLGGWLEATLPLSSRGVHPLRLFARATPALTLDGPALGLEVRASLDVLLSSSSGLMAGPFFQLSRGQVAANGWFGGLSVSY